MAQGSKKKGELSHMYTMKCGSQCHPPCATRTIVASDAVPNQLKIANNLDSGRIASG